MMKPGLLEVEDFTGAYARWADDRCPCCGAPLDFYDDPQPIAEGVMLCGYCIENEHGKEDAEFIPMMLLAIARRM